MGWNNSRIELKKLILLMGRIPNFIISKPK